MTIQSAHNHVSNPGPEAPGTLGNASPQFTRASRAASPSTQVTSTNSEVGISTSPEAETPVLSSDDEDAYAPSFHPPDIEVMNRLIANTQDTQAWLRNLPGNTAFNRNMPFPPAYAMVLTSTLPGHWLRTDLVDYFLQQCMDTRCQHQRTRVLLAPCSAGSGILGGSSAADALRSVLTPHVLEQGSDFTHPLEAHTILIPACHSHHYTLTALQVDPTTSLPQAVYWYDSMGNSPPGHLADSITTALRQCYATHTAYTDKTPQGLLTGRPTPNPTVVRVPQQKDGWQCGYYMMAVALRIMWEGPNTAAGPIPHLAQEPYSLLREHVIRCFFTDVTPSPDLITQLLSPPTAPTQNTPAKSVPRTTRKLSPPSSDPSMPTGLRPQSPNAPRVGASLRPSGRCRKTTTPRHLCPDKRPLEPRRGGINKRQQRHHFHPTQCPPALR